VYEAHQYVRDGGDFCRHVLLRFELFADVLPGMCEIPQRVLQQGVVRFEVLDQSQLLLQRGRQGLRVLAHLLCRRARYCRTLGAQRIRYLGELLTDLRQRIIIGK
jgi:hypothetical protein